MKSVVINLKDNVGVFLKGFSLNLFLSWILFTSFFCYQYIIRLLPNDKTMNYIINYYSTDSYYIGQFMFFHFIFGIIGSVPIGILIDKFGPKKIAILSIFFIVLSFLFMISDSSIYVLYSSIVIGFFSAAATLCLFKEISLKFSVKRFCFILFNRYSKRYIFS